MNEHRSFNGLQEINSSPMHTGKCASFIDLNREKISSFSAVGGIASKDKGFCVNLDPKYTDFAQSDMNCGIFAHLYPKFNSDLCHLSLKGSPKLGRFHLSKMSSFSFNTSMHYCILFIHRRNCHSHSF